MESRPGAVRTKIQIELIRQSEVYENTAYSLVQTSRSDESAPTLQYKPTIPDDEKAIQNPHIIASADDDSSGAVIFSKHVLS